MVGSIGSVVFRPLFVQQPGVDSAFFVVVGVSLEFRYLGPQYLTLVRLHSGLEVILNFLEVNLTASGFECLF